MSKPHNLCHEPPLQDTSEVRDNYLGKATRLGIRLKLVTLKSSSLGYDLRPGKCLNLWKLITFVLLRMATQRVWSGVGLVATR